MRKFLDVVRLTPRAIEKAAVTCGSCPFSLSCMIGEGGNGWKFSCCGMSAVEADGLLIAVDCAKNGFRQDEEAKRWALCPLCSGGIMEVVLRGLKDSKQDPNRYLRTVHSSVPAAKRLEMFQAKLEEANRVLAEEKARAQRSS